MSPVISVLYFISLFITLSLTSTVKWLPNASFKLASNFKDGKLPCSKQTVVFPESVFGSIMIATGTEVRGFILPENGELILDGTLSFGSDSADSKCNDGNAYYTDKTSSAWNQADVWSSDKFNEATPDSERIPCFSDIVVFPKDAKVTVALPLQTQFIKSLVTENNTWDDSRIFYQSVTSESDGTQQFILNDLGQTGLSINKPFSCTLFGCPCQIHPLEIDCSVKFCPKTECVHPVKPLGFCCEVCGGYIVFDMDMGFDRVHFADLVDNVISSYGSSKVEYHIGFVSEVPIRRLQLVVVDKGEYEGSSTEIITDVSYKMNEKWFKGEKLTLISGSPLNKTGGGTIFTSMFFAVVIVLGAVYVYYYKIPDVRFPFLGRGIGSAFSRFERRSDSIVSLTRRDSVVSTRAGFRNPLYDSRRGRVQVTESAVED